MRIVVVGAGKMGYSIAKLLADGSYDVVVIEQEDERRQVVKDSLDVLTIQGNGCSPEVLDMPEVRNADVFIAVTDSDEVNLVACIRHIEQEFLSERTVLNVSQNLLHSLLGVLSDDLRTCDVVAVLSSI